MVFQLPAGHERGTRIHFLDYKPFNKCNITDKTVAFGEKPLLGQARGIKNCTNKPGGPFQTLKA